MSLVTELQQEVEAQEMLILDARKQNDLLKAENEKLKELVRIAVKYCDSGTCDGCPIQGESGSCPYPYMARELGIEAES